jgi:class 3 adenylate cyclase
MSQLVDDALAAGRAALERKEWSEAYELLRQADAENELGASDLELFAAAALWTGEFKDALSVMERAYAALVQEGEKARAAYVAVELAHSYSGQLQPAVAQGWMSRAKRLLDDEPEGFAHGYWALQQALFMQGKHDFDGAIALAKRAEEIGKRFGDRNLEVRGMQRQGTALIEKGDVAEGQLLLDEASTAAFGGELDPRSTLIVYCNTIGACRDLADYDRAGEWTDRATEFCESVSASAFPGLCRVNRAEVMRFKGKLTEAGAVARKAGEELRMWCPRIAGAAFYELGEARLRLGELAQAEASFREADEYGKDPEPGLSLLRLGQGNIKGALSSIRRALSDDTLGIPARVRLLPAAVEIAIAADELDEAQGYVDELIESAETYDTSALKASGAFARGTVKLARGDAAGAYSCLRQARTFWDATGATYDVARTREALGRAARLDGDEERAVWEFQAAAARFERLGALRDAERLAELLAVKKTVMKTFLFTDIVRSTDLLSTIEDRHWANALRLHDDALRSIFADWEGQVVDHTGDGFFVAFDHGEQAVRAAIAVQKTVDQEFVFDVRIGVHTDGALQQGESYHGRGVHAAARIGAQAGGREILGSQVTLDALEDFPTKNHRAATLKGFKDPINVCSVDWEKR